MSKDAAAAFTERINALLDDCRRYNQDLREAAGHLDDVARAYGYSEDEIVDSFRGTR